MASALSLFHTLLAFGFSVVLYLACSTYITKKSRGSLPPGPFRWPIVGNAFVMPTNKEWIKFAEWQKIYGDVIYLSIFGRPIIVLNSAKAALDLLDKRSSIYSDRPHMVMAGDLVGWGNVLGLLPYNERFRQTRRSMHQALGPRTAQVFHPLEEQKTARFLKRLLETPEHFIDHIRHTTAAIILDISHGYEVSETHADTLVTLAESTMNEFSIVVTPGAFLVDFLPWLRYLPSWLPGMRFRRQATIWGRSLVDMLEIPHNFTKAQIAEGTARPSFTQKLLEGGYTPETESVIKWAALSIYGGGSDTVACGSDTSIGSLHRLLQTVSSISTFFLAMCTHPRVQRAAQSEIDTVIGNGRLPTLADRVQLPYIGAIVKEVLRWAPIAPLGMPHSLVQEDTYNGYNIPAGSVVIPNIWAMLHDPDMFPNPSEFIPERFLGSDKVEGAGANPTQLAFGFGRRTCPGQHLAEPSIFLAVAMTLSTFTITKASDEQGKVIEPEIEWMPGTISHPKPFKCKIEPRSSHAADLIRRAVTDDGASS